MKKKKVKELLYRIRFEIIYEIDAQKRMDENTAPQFVRDDISFEYGYKRGLTEAAMIMLDRIYEKFPEEEENEKA